jgi:hypothetical protein
MCHMIKVFCPICEAGHFAVPSNDEQRIACGQCGNSFVLLGGLEASYKIHDTPPNPQASQSQTTEKRTSNNKLPSREPIPNIPPSIKPATRPISDISLRINSRPATYYRVVAEEGEVVDVRYISEQYIVGQGNLIGFGQFGRGHNNYHGNLFVNGRSVVGTHYSHCTVFFTRDRNERDTQYIWLAATPPILKGHVLRNTFLLNLYGDRLWASTFNYNTAQLILHVSEHDVCNHLGICDRLAIQVPLTDKEIAARSKEVKYFLLAGNAAILALICTLIIVVMLSIAKRIDGAFDILCAIVGTTIIAAIASYLHAYSLASQQNSKQILVKNDELLPLTLLASM